METVSRIENVVLHRLQSLKSGSVTTMWDRIVIRIGDKYNVSGVDDTVSWRKAPYTIEEAERLIRSR